MTKVKHGGGGTLERKETGIDGDRKNAVCRKITVVRNSIVVDKSTLTEGQINHRLITSLMIINEYVLYP